MAVPRRPDTRQRIEKAALALFAAKGVDATTTKDIAAEVDISEGAIYRHFRSKDDLAWQLFSSRYAALAGHIDAIMAETAGLPERIERTVALFCALFDDRPDEFTFILLSQHSQLTRVTDAMASPVASLRRMFQAGIDRDECRGDDPDLLAAMALGLVTQPATFMVYGRLARPLDRLAPVLVDAIGRTVLR